MSLERLLYDLSINSSEMKDVGVVCVLSEVRERLEERSSDTPSVLRRTAEVLRVSPRSWLFPDSSCDLHRAYRDLVNSCVKHAALPLCDTDSGTLAGSGYAEIPGRAVLVGGALQALSARLREAVRCGHSGDSGASGASGASRASGASGASGASRASGDSRASGASRASGDSETLGASRDSGASGAKALLHTLTPALCIFSITHLHKHPWTDGSSRKCALELLNHTVTASGSSSVQELLCGGEGGESPGVLGSILDTLQPDMTKENWKRNESVKHVFSWLLVQVGRPYLADYLDKVFPLSLLISDDYQTENKVLGVHCLHHIVLHVPAADLRQFNRAQVLYDALYNHLYTSEAPLIQVVLPCLIDLLPVLEKPLGHAGLGAPRTPNRSDSVLRLVLTHMEMEHKLALRRIYASNLLLFVEKMGIAVARHLKRLERVIVGYLEVSDGPEEKARLSILEVLERTIQVAWPRMECRMSVLAKSLLRFLVDVSAESLSPELTEELLNRATRCLLLLDHCSHGRLRVELKELDSSCVCERVLKHIQDLTRAECVS